MSTYDYAPPRPSTNEVQETLRLMPNGARQKLITHSHTDHLEHIDPVTLAFYEKHNMVTIPTKGENKGHKIFSAHGKKVRHAYHMKIEGKTT